MLPPHPFSGEFYAEPAKGLDSLLRICNNTPMRKLRQLRQEAGYSLAQVSQQIHGISEATLSRIETGEIESPSYWLIRKLEQFYGVSGDELLAEIPEDL